VCGFVYRADSDDSITGKYVFSADGSIIGTAICSLGNLLIIEAKSIEEGEEEEANEKTRKYEIPLIEVKEVIGNSLILKSKKEYVLQTYLKSSNRS
jgi:hypothetical protein